LAIAGLLDSSIRDPHELLSRGSLWERLGQWRLAVADYRAVLEARPESAYAAYRLARCLAIETDRGPALEAVRWAREAVRLASGNATYCCTLGVCLYRAGEFAEAARLLEDYTPHDPPWAGLHWLFLAMTRQRLGQTSEAQAELAKAMRWRAETSALSPEMDAEFRSRLSEAQFVLAGSVPELPPNAFAR
jgi:predicted Zn-dependent protease